MLETASHSKNKANVSHSQNKNCTCQNLVVLYIAYMTQFRDKLSGIFLRDVGSEGQGVLALSIGEDLRWKKFNNYFS